MTKSSGEQIHIEDSSETIEHPGDVDTMAQKTHLTSEGADTEEGGYEHESNVLGSEVTDGDTGELPSQITPDRNTIGEHFDKLRWNKLSPKAKGVCLSLGGFAAGMAVVVSMQLGQNEESRLEASGNDSRGTEEPSEADGTETIGGNDNLDIINETGNEDFDNNESGEQDEVQDLHEKDKDDWLTQWSAEADLVNGLRNEHSSTEEFTENLIGNLRLRLNGVENAESGTSDFSEIRILSGLVPIVKNKGEVIAIENPVIYGMRPTNAAETAYSWSWRADSDKPIIDDYFIIYNDQEGNKQGFALVDGVAQWPSDNSIEVVGMFAERGGAKITQGRVSKDSLQDNDESFIVRKDDGTGGVKVTGQASAYEDVGEAWDALTAQNQDLEPVSLEEALSSIKHAK